MILSERDSLLVLNLIENPPAPNAGLRAAFTALSRSEYQDRFVSDRLGSILKSRLNIICARRGHSSSRSSLVAPSASCG